MIAAAVKIAAAATSESPRGLRSREDSAAALIGFETCCGVPTERRGRKAAPAEFPEQ